MNKIALSLILIGLLTSTAFSAGKSDLDSIPFKFFASFRRIEKGNPIIAGKVPEWAAAAHAIVVDQTVHYIWALRGQKDRRWTMMHSFAPVSDPSVVKHDPRNPILTPSADGFDSLATEYPFPFWNPHDRTYYAYYLGRPRSFPKQTGLLIRGDDFAEWRRVLPGPVIAAEAEYERDGSSHPSVVVVGDTIHIIYTGESKKPPVICHATAPVSDPAKATKDPANPVFRGTGKAWDSLGVREAEIFKGPHYFHILYGGSDGKVWRIGHVRTRDFRTFEPNPYNPVFVPPSDREAWDCDGILTPQVFEAGGFYYLLYAGKKGGEWQTGLARTEWPRKEAVRTVAGNPAEGKLESFLGEPKLDVQQVHKGGRFPNIVVGVDGSLLALWGGVKVRRSEDGGETWGPEILVADGFMGGGAIVNETNGEILAFVEKHHPPAPLTVYRSKDHGKTWSAMDVVIKPDSRGNVPSMHMNEHGITLRHGEYAGRIIRAARHYAGKNERSRWPQHYTTAVYSDDGGKNWNTSDPFPAMGTGEAMIAELCDGRLYYNSRRHWAPEGENPRRRWTAWSEDGGETWKNLSICEVLPDGPQSTNYGCMGGLVRLPIRDRDILIYSNCDSPEGRRLGTVWASFDGGKTWPLKRLVQKGSFAYSSLTAGRPGTKSEGWIYLHFESNGSKVARFNLSWLLKGTKTEDGGLPKRLSNP